MYFMRMYFVRRRIGGRLHRQNIETKTRCQTTGTRREDEPVLWSCLEGGSTCTRGTKVLWFTYRRCQYDTSGREYNFLLGPAFAMLNVPRLNENKSVCYTHDCRVLLRHNCPYLWFWENVFCSLIFLTLYNP